MKHSLILFSLAVSFSAHASVHCITPDSADSEGPLSINIFSTPPPTRGMAHMMVTIKTGSGQTLYFGEISENERGYDGSDFALTATDGSADRYKLSVSLAPDSWNGKSVISALPVLCEFN